MGFSTQSHAVFVDSVDMLVDRRHSRPTFSLAREQYLGLYSFAVNTVLQNENGVEGYHTMPFILSMSVSMSLCAVARAVLS